MLVHGKRRDISTKRVLIVDDVSYNLDFEEELIRSLMRDIEFDILVDIASTVEDAKEKIDTSEPYDAMIIDMNLPDGTGTEIAHIAHAKSIDTRLAALTIYPSKYEDQQSYFDIYLKKPIMPDEYKKNFRYLLQLD